eukprot:1150956-Pelagomonas_calceolata.AAC.2
MSKEAHAREDIRKGRAIMSWFVASCKGTHHAVLCVALREGGHRAVSYKGRHYVIMEHPVKGRHHVREGILSKGGIMSKKASCEGRHPVKGGIM